MELTPDLEYLVEKWIRRGTAVYAEICEASAGYGPDLADALADKLIAARVRLVDEKDVTITAQTNVLMNNLRLVELVSLALQLPAAPSVRRRLYEGILGQRTYELDLHRLDYVDSDAEWYYLSPAFIRLQQAIRHLFDGGHIPFSREWRSKKDNQTYLKGLIAHPLFAERILPLIRDHYVRLREVRLLLRWIEATGKRDPAMTDVIQAGLKADGAEWVRGLLFSNRASTADGALRNRRDVCFSCLPEKRCLPLQNVEDPQHVLWEYRRSELDTLLVNRYPGTPFESCVLKDALLAKFFIPYSLVVPSKRFMIEMRCLQDAAVVLPKNAGKYCPSLDTWPLVIEE